MPPGDDLCPDTDQTTTLQLNGKAEKSFNGAFSSDDAPDALPPIVYHYLTFQTSLPVPSRSPSTNIEGPHPPQPDLKKYMSPFEWPNSRKNFIMALSCIATMTTAFTAGAYAPAARQMALEWHVSEIAVLVGITTFCCGFAMAPMVLAPFSEINGRYPVFVGAGILYLICQICCAVTRSYPGMVVARFWLGCGSSVFSTMVGGVVSDLYHAEERNTPMALFSGAALFGTGLGPLVSGFIVQSGNWRWVFWLQVITCGLIIGSISLFFKETRGSILLSRKARVLNRWMEDCEAAGYIGFDMPASPGSEGVESQRIRWKVKSDEERVSVSRMIGISVYRPMHFLITEPVVFYLSLFVSFAWAILYLTFAAIPVVYGRSYNFGVQQSGAVFSAMCVGALISTFLSIYQAPL
jgi:multidrug resistance protein